MNYVVQPGDTLFSLARRFGTTVDAIVAANNLSDPNLLYPGQVLFIPLDFPRPTAACPLLGPGSCGPDVIRLQNLLAQAGFNPGSIDGLYGTRTQNAVLALQQAQDINPTGFADIDTWTVLGIDCGLPPVNRGTVFSRHLEYILFTDSPTYVQGERVIITFVKLNTSNQAVTFTYPTGTEAEFVIETPDRQEIRRFSVPTGGAAHTVTLNPGERENFVVTWDMLSNTGAVAAPGDYIVRATNLATGVDNAVGIQILG